jgi:hypothetical protein
MPRKTIAVERVLELANHYLRTSDGAESKMEHKRMGVASLLEAILAECDAYSGYSYLGADQVAAGCKPGIARDADGAVIDFPDVSRRVYYQAAGLRTKCRAPR